MDISFEQSGTIAILSLSGALTATTAEALIDRGLSCCVPPNTGILISFKEVPRLASAGIRALMLIRRRCEERSVRLALCEANDLILELFEIAGLTDLFQIHSDPASALASLNGR